MSLPRLVDSSVVTRVTMIPAVMAARPGRIKTIVDTRFDKNDEELLKEKEFVEKVDELWHLVREEAIKAQMGRSTRAQESEA